MHPALQDLAYEKIQELMESNKLLPGQLYSESNLSKQMGISRTPLRRALQKMEQEGLVEVLPQRGFWVCQFTEKDIREIFQLRKLLEGFAIESICKADKNVDFGLIRSNVIDQESAQRLNDYNTFVLENKKFHQAIVQATGNERLYKIYEVLRMSVDAVGRHILSRRQHWQQSVDEHKHILEAIERRDPEKAREALYAHFDASERVLREGLRGLEK
jgi:DNA-binding GntR family transcriptional regulator